jgi:hypothetical protein
MERATMIVASIDLGNDIHFVIMVREATVRPLNGSWSA